MYENRTTENRERVLWFIAIGVVSSIVDIGLLYILCLRRLKRRYRSSWGYFWLCLKDGAQHNWGFLSLLAMAYVGSLLLF